MTAYCGMLDPSGKPLPSILNNGKRKQTFDNWMDNESTYRMYYNRLLDLAMSVFEWKNLPEGVDARMLEWWLMRHGYCVFFHDDDLKDNPNCPEGYAVLECMLTGDWNMYYLPNQRVAYSIDGMNVDLDEDNSVLIFNNYLRSDMIFVISQFAWRLANIERAIDVNASNQKTTKVIRVDEKQRLTATNFLMDVYGNKISTMVDKNVDLSGMEPIDLTSPFVADKLQVLKHQIWNEALTYLGVENVNTEKKERLISDEVFSNMGDVEAQRFTRLNARKQACSQIKSLFNLDVDVDFRSGIYIHADGYGAQEIPTSGMKDTTALTEEAGYESDDSSLIAMLKRIFAGGSK